MEILFMFKKKPEIIKKEETEEGKQKPSKTKNQNKNPAHCLVRWLTLFFFKTYRTSFLQAIYSYLPTKKANFFH